MTMNFLKSKLIKKEELEEYKNKGKATFEGKYYEYFGKEDLGTPTYFETEFVECFKKYKKPIHKLTENEISKFSITNCKSYFSGLLNQKEENRKIYSIEIEIEKEYKNSNYKKYKVYLIDYK